MDIIIGKGVEDSKPASGGNEPHCKVKFYGKFSLQRLSWLLAPLYLFILIPDLSVPLLYSPCSNIHEFGKIF